MPKGHFALPFLLSLVLLIGPAAAQSAPVKVAYVTITVRGDYQPLDSATVNSVLLEAFKDSAPELEFVPLQVDAESLDPEAAVEQALATARAEGADLIAWGSVSFERAAQNSRGDVFNQGRLKLLITAIADIQVASVPTQERILNQPTMVTSTDQSSAFTETGDPQLEIRLARESLTEAAQTIVGVVRQRRASGS
jgi:hypothetical protein